jgi:hypothetical protein
MYICPQPTILIAYCTVTPFSKQAFTTLKFILLLSDCKLSFFYQEPMYEASIIKCIATVEERGAGQ